MPKTKLRRFKENLTFPNLFQLRYHEILRGFPLKGNWNSGQFHNEHPLTLELGCGKGEYTIGLALRHPERNYIGIDIKGARLWRGCKTALEQNIQNVAFLRTQIGHIETFFNKEEVDEIWITFPDPQGHKERKRLTSPVFLDKYKRILSPDAIIHLKTDNAEFFDYTLSVIAAKGHSLLYSTHDLYHTDQDNDILSIRTFYESMFMEQGKAICYLKFSLKQ